MPKKEPYRKQADIERNKKKKKRPVTKEEGISDDHSFLVGRIYKVYLRPPIQLVEIAF